MQIVLQFDLVILAGKTSGGQAGFIIGQVARGNPTLSGCCCCTQASAPTVAKVTKKQRQLSGRCCNILNAVFVATPVAVRRAGASARKCQTTRAQSLPKVYCLAHVLLRSQLAALCSLLWIVQLFHFISHSTTFWKTFA